MKGNKLWLVLGLIIFIIVGVSGFLLLQKQQMISKINSYEGCANAGFPIMDSYPPQCTLPNGKSFTQNIGNELKFHDEILVSNPRPNQKITSPLKITGQAKGSWYFEGSFSGELFDAKNVSLGTATLTAQGEWMTENFVPFTGDLSFKIPTTLNGTFVIKNANPSGDPSNDKKLIIPVIFK